MSALKVLLLSLVVAGCGVEINDRPVGFCSGSEMVCRQHEVTACFHGTWRLVTGCDAGTCPYLRADGGWEICQ